MKQKNFYGLILAFYVISLSMLMAQQEGTFSKDASAALAQAKATLASVAGRPDYGFGVIEWVANQTKYPTSLYFEKTIHDLLPADTIIRIQSLDPAQKGKYFAVRKTKGKTFSFLADTADANDKETLFTVSRRLSSDDLKDWLGFSHITALDNMMQTILDTGDVNFPNKNFREEENEESHWEIIGNTIEKCYLRNRKTGGFLAPFAGQKEVRVEGDAGKDKLVREVLKDVVGLEPSGFEIVGAWYGSVDAINDIENKLNVLKKLDPSQIKPADEWFEVTDKVRPLGLAKGKIEIPADFDTYFERDPAPLVASASSKLGGMKLSQSAQEKMGISDSDLAQVGEKPKLKFFAMQLIINGESVFIKAPNGLPFSYAVSQTSKLGTMLTYKNNAWQGPVLTYNSIITIKSDAFPDRVLWTLGDNRLGAQHCELLVGPSDEARAQEGAQYFMIRAKDNPNKLGPIMYGDEIEIISLWGGAGQPANTGLFNSGRKWWLYTGTSRFGNNLVNEIVISKPDHPQTQNGQQLFALQSKTNKTGVVHQNDPLYIISKSPFGSAKDTKLWVNQDSRYGTRWYEVLVKDDWGPVAIKKDRSVEQGVFRIQAAGIDEKVKSIYKGTGVTTISPNPGKLLQVSIRTDNEIWGVNLVGEVWSWNGKVWKQEAPTSVPIKHVSVSQKSEAGKPSEVWAVNTENKVFKYAKNRWIPVQGELKQVSVIAPDTVWGIGNDNFIYKFTEAGGGWEKNSPGDKSIVALSTSAGGDVWAVDSRSQIWSLGKEKTWNIVESPQGRPRIIQIAVKTDNDAWALSANNIIYHWNGNSWNVVDGKLSNIAVASGLKETVIPGKKEKRFVELVTTIQGEPGSKEVQSALINLEIVKLGMGGNIASKTEAQCNIPVNKKPRLSGFAETRTQEFAPGSVLSISPLLGRGVAWPETSLETPGNCTVIFAARASDKGDIQIMFGPDISDNYTFKVVIGGWGNTKSAIVKRNVDKDGTPSEEVVCEVDRQQNPLAIVSPGNFTPYWISVNDGFVMVGMGSPGENVFMAQRLDIDASSIFRVGFSCNKAKVDYTEIQYMPPVIARAPGRIFAQSIKPLSAPQNNFIWSEFPFRVQDQGSISFTIQGSESVSLGLAKDTTQDLPEYTVEFGAKGNTGISIRKFDQTTKKYKTRMFVPTSTFPAAKLDPKKAIPFWVSFYDGVFAVGQGQLGQNLLLVLNDLNAYEGIKKIGFGAKVAGTINNLRISLPLNLSVEQKVEAYKRGPIWYKFQGAVTIILPFEYQFSQVGRSVIVKDNVNDATYHPGALPQQGTLYYFRVAIHDDGYPEMIWSKEPENKQIIDIQKAVVQASAATTLELQQSDITMKEGARLSQLQRSAGDVIRARAQGMQSTAQTLTSAGQAMALGAGPALIPSLIALGSAAAFTGAAAGVAKAAEDKLVEAAKLDAAGAQTEATLQKRALDRESLASQLQFQANLLQGTAQFAFRDQKSYVFVDNPERAALGSANIPQDAIVNQKQADAELRQGMGIQPSSPKNFELMITIMQSVVNRITHAFVVTDYLKKSFFSMMRNVYDSYQQLFGTKPDTRIANNFIGLFASAMNNSYLLDASNDISTRDTWYNWTNRLAHSLLRQSPSITLQPLYGEYIWIPKPFDVPGKGSITIEVEAEHDVFVCLAKEQERVRNTPADLYEIVLGGWDNTKHAIRLQSLGRSVKEFTKDQYPETMLLPYSPQRYTIGFDNGIISIQCGKKVMAWKDPYPVQGIKYVGISTWDMPVTFKKISFTTISTPTTPKTTTQPAPKQQPVKVIPPQPAQPKPVAAPVATTPSVDTTKPAVKKIIVVKKKTTDTLDQQTTDGQ